MTLTETLEALEALGDEKTRSYNSKQGAGDIHYVVKPGHIRKITKKIKDKNNFVFPLRRIKLENMLNTKPSDK